jgi:carbon-monoxide dehydrogenase large subunit
MGARIRRREDPRLITGASTYVDDLVLPGMAFMAVLRSPHAHARVRSINVDAARRLPGVLAVVTAADIKDRLSGPMPLEVDMGLMFPNANIPPRGPLATDKVRYVGDPIAAVVVA